MLSQDAEHLFRRWLATSLNRLLPLRLLVRLTADYWLPTTLSALCLLPSIYCSNNHEAHKGHEEEKLLWFTLCASGPLWLHS
jgi:hypothetical protein